MQLGEVDISTITSNLKSRDDIPRLLLALQYIWTNIELRNQVIKVLEQGLRTNHYFPEFLDK